MNAERLSSRCLAAGAAVIFFFTGCATPRDPVRVVVPNLSINGQSVHMVLDTGAGSTVIYNTTATRAGLRFTAQGQKAAAGEFEIVTGISDAAKVRMGSQSFTARLPVFTVPATAKEDGVIGWPEVRNNILAFDTVHNVVRRVAQCPDETSGWLKLKVRTSNTLLLEIPLSNGQTGIFLLDTGSPQGIQLSPELWEAFKNAHPKTAVTSVKHFSWAIGSFTAESMMVDEMNLGALILKNVPVENMPANQAVWFGRVVPEATAVGVIGMAAIRRMNLVVDGRNKVAWLKPNSRPVGSAKFGNWTVAENVHLQCDSLLVRSGMEYGSKGNFDAAIAEYTRALEINPANSDAYAIRGMARQIKGEFAEAAADYDKVIELNPSNSISAQLHRQTLRVRLGQPANDFADVVAGWHNNWDRTIGMFVADQLDEDSLLAAIQEANPAQAVNQHCEAFYYIGLRRLDHGDKAGARLFFQKSVSTGVSGYIEYQFASAELARLQAPPVSAIR